MREPRDKEKPEKTLERFNKEALDFMIENQNKIAVAIVYALSHLNQPLIAGYQRYFNNNVILKYDSKAVFAHNADLPDFLCAYFILVRKPEKTDKKEIVEDSRVYVNNFLEFNMEILSGISCFIFDIQSGEVIERVDRGSKESIESVEFLNIG
ncbi:MAG: hypothetical protein OXC97_05565 [Candidatus Dadabacteria bacterium]|nr:hypothetical protein [Candidatus Dadabacteria bacterium]